MPMASITVTLDQENRCYGFPLIYMNCVYSHFFKEVHIQDELMVAAGLNSGGGGGGGGGGGWK